MFKAKIANALLAVAGWLDRFSGNTSRINLNHPRSNNNNNLPITHHNGWVSLSMDDLMNHGVTPLTLNAIVNTESVWIGEITVDWFKQIHWWSKADILRYSLAVRKKGYVEEESVSKLDGKRELPDSSYLSTKRLITVCSVLHNFAIPKHLFLFDQYTYLNILRYVVLTNCYNLDKNTVEPPSYVNLNSLKHKREVTTLLKKQEQIVIVRNLSATIEAVVNNFSFKDYFNNIDTIYRLPNFYVLRTSIKATCQENEYIENLTDFQLKKVLTCIFLLNELAIPRDYIYVDTDVIDWVNKAGAYTVSKKKLTKPSKQT